MKNRAIQIGAIFFLLGLCQTPATIRYVDLNSASPTPPYTAWSTAATDIQSAVDAADVGDVVLVTNGTYLTGDNVDANDPDQDATCVDVDKALVLQSVNGPALTIIDGGGSNRCVYLSSNSIFGGFTLTNGAALDGGGAYCESNVAISYCTVIHNSANNSGGGVFGGRLFNSSVISNSCDNGAGVEGCVVTDCVISGSDGFFSAGADNSTLFHSVLTNNHSLYAAGAANSTLYRCVIAYNSAGAGAAAYGSALHDCAVFNNNSDEGADLEFGTAVNCTIVNNDDAVGECNVTNCIIYFNGINVDTDNFSPGNTDHCCVTPMPTNGYGNFTNDPGLVNYAANDFHLLSNSPCINSGNNSAVAVTNDLDGNPRIAGGTVDVGAFEFQSPTSVLSYAWAQQYGLPTDGSVDYADLDSTGMNNWQKWIAGLNPTNPASVLAMLPPGAASNSMGVQVSWQSVNTRMYYLQRGSALAPQPAFSTIQDNIAGQSGTTSFTDTTATNNGPYFYRVGVQ